MPKIRDLGIKVIPETMRPPEAGGGAGGGGAAQICNPTYKVCTDCTIQPFSICGGTHCRWPTLVTCHFHTWCGCTFYGQGITIICDPITNACGPVSLCGGTIIDTTIYQQAGGLSQEHAAALRTALKKELDGLEEHLKSAATAKKEKK